MKRFLIILFSVLVVLGLTSCDPTAGQVIGAHLNRDLIAGQDLDKVHPELAGNMCQNGVSVANVDLEHRIRQCIGYDALNFNYVVLGQVYTPPWF